MSIYLAGAGWVTPQGEGLAEVWQAIRAGQPAPQRAFPERAGEPTRFYAPVPEKKADPLTRHPRLRRASAISYFAATAGLAALADAGIGDPGEWSQRGALIFAVSGGSVVYTRKFYDQVVREGSGSPLLFPETVYNAPASHLAALLGLTGSTYTLVGDASAGLSALAFGQQLMETGQAEHCLIVGAEEADWVLEKGYRDWRFAARTPGGPGMLVAEGAAAVVLASSGTTRLEKITDGVPFFRRAEAGESLAAALAQLNECEAPEQMIGSANGTFIDALEQAAVTAAFGPLPAIFPKRSLGEALGASALQQIVCAMQSLREGSATRVLVPVLGLNHQAAAALVSRAASPAI